MPKPFLLEVDYLDGKPLAAYLRLAPARKGHVATTREIRPGVLVDFAADGQPLGVEIVHPAMTSIDTIEEVLREIHGPSVPRETFGPLRAA